MRRGRVRTGLIVILLLIVVMKGFPQTTVGSTPANPITFSDLEAWIGDSRATLNLFEETIRSDMLAARLNFSYSPNPMYLMMDDGTVYSTAYNHITFQGMFWGPLFNFAVWEIPAFVYDIILYSTKGDKSFGMTKFNLSLLTNSIEAYETQSGEVVPVSGIFHINVLFTTDLLLLDMRTYDNNFWGKSGMSLLGRSYAGLTFKIMEAYYLFAGFNFIHYPYLQGWQDFINEEPTFADVGGVPRYDQEAVAHNYDSFYLLYETRTKLYFYHNFFDFLQIRTLFNIGAEKLLDLFGLGFVFTLWDKWDVNSYLSYLSISEKWSLDFTGGVELLPWLDMTYEYNFALKPFNLVDYFQVGLSAAWTIKSTPLGDYGIQVVTYGNTYYRDGTRQYGFLAALGFNAPLSGRIYIGAGYNADKTMQTLPFTDNNWIFFVNMEVGMNNDINYRLEPLM